ncbi:polyamine-modulated factor 1-binding protein 1-like [Rhopilema esculentum]|uniref:polyamine-modulated factor 1-binding protein 1-like n=1 Tax=Rhopilema esculentum TaxID=499914 RepID=UPI0031E2866C
MKIEDYLERELVLNEEVKSLKEENRNLREEKMAESLSSQAIIESLEELVQEQKEDHEIMVQKLQNELTISRDQEAAQSGQICEVKQQALSANEKLSESNAKINTIEKEKAELEMKAKEVKGKVMMLEEDASNNLAKLKELSNEVAEWRTRAEESGDRCLSLTKKVSHLITLHYNVWLLKQRLSQLFLNLAKQISGNVLRQYFYFLCPKIENCFLHIHKYQTREKRFLGLDLSKEYSR